MYWDLAFGKRPAEELYRYTGDPACIENLAEQPACRETRDTLARELFEKLRAEEDPRVTGEGPPLDENPVAKADVRGFYERFEKGFGGRLGPGPRGSPLGLEPFREEPDAAVGVVKAYRGVALDPAVESNKAHIHDVPAVRGLLVRGPGPIQQDVAGRGGVRPVVHRDVHFSGVEHDQLVKVVDLSPEGPVRARPDARGMAERGGVSAQTAILRKISQFSPLRPASAKAQCDEA